MFLCIFTAVGLFLLISLINKKLGKDKILLNLIFAILLLTFFIDNINGSSSFSSYKSSLNFYKNNFAGIASIPLYRSIINRNVKVKQALSLPLNNESITFREFRLEESGSQQ
jgi:surface polysaccharide O-acyltransferase-like enzyme